MKILDNGIAIVETDTHIGKWIQESGRIDHDMTVQDYIIPMFQPDWTVLDVGADVGSHTVRYAERARRVIAFEPNPEEFRCLVHNTKHLPNVLCLPVALGLNDEWRKLMRCENEGAGHLHPHEDGDTWVVRLDDLNFRKLDFIKIDAEGFEWHILGGAKRTIERVRPIILMEMNAGALYRFDRTYRDIFELLASHNYGWRSFPNGCDLVNTEQYDLLATPK